VPERGTTGNYRDLAPRVGFAYDLAGQGRTSIRGGIGMFYDSRFNGNTDNFRGCHSLQFFAELDAASGALQQSSDRSQQPLPNSVPARKGRGFPDACSGVHVRYQRKVSAAGHLQLESDPGAPVWGRLVGGLAYAGSHRSHILIFQELNPAIFTAGNSLSTDQRRALKPFGRITQFSPIGNSSYNSLQATAEKRFGKSLPLTLRANYTFSKSIDDIPLNGTYQAIPYYMAGAGRFERGLSNFDHPHRFVVSYDWQLPALSRANAVMRTVLGNWETTGVFTAMSGDTLTVTAGRDVSGTGIGQDRADFIGQPYGPGACNNRSPCVNWLIPGSFKLPAAGAFGNVGKGSLRGPSLMNWDVGVFKNFPLTEEWRLQFRAEFFNATNSANFNDPTLSVNSGGFGAITSAQDPRIGQLALKLYF
jgi:hypothetical protein